jgi:hypothetical protein
MKKRIYYAICFQDFNLNEKKVSHLDPVSEGAFSLFYHRSDAMWNSTEDDKIVRVLVTIEPVPSKKRTKK